MDSTVSSMASTALGGFKTGALAQFSSVVPVALLLVVSIAVVYFMIRTFRSIVHI